MTLTFHAAEKGAGLNCMPLSAHRGAMTIRSGALLITVWTTALLTQFHIKPVK